MSTRPTLEYRHSATADDHSLNRTVLVLQSREGFFWIHILLTACAGLVVAYVGPLLAASLLFAILGRLGVPLPRNDSWLVLFTAAGLLGILFWYERRTRGQFLNQSIEDHRDWFHGRASSYGEFEARYQIASFMIVVELLLWGPRMLLSALDRSRTRQALRHVSLTRAAEIIADLQRADGGVLIRNLQRPNESLEELRGTLGYLSLFDWIGASKDGTRTWLLTDARKRLRS